MGSISKDQEIVICQKAIDNYGQAIQQVVAMEEMGELIQAISKSIRGEKHNVEEEIADVSIILTQLTIMYDYKKVEEFRNEKLKRLKDMVV